MTTEFKWPLNTRLVIRGDTKRWAHGFPPGVHVNVIGFFASKGTPGYRVMDAGGEEWHVAEADLEPVWEEPTADEIETAIQSIKAVTIPNKPKEAKEAGAMEIVVVTKVPNEGDGGNLALASLDLRWATGEKDENHVDKTVTFKDALTEMLGDERQALGFMLNLREPVFYQGEVLVLNEYGREVGYPGRKPSKWFVEVETVASLEEAYELSQKIIRGDS